MIWTDGLWEDTSGLVANGNNSLELYGKDLAYDEENNLRSKSTKYVTIYKHNADKDNNNIAQTENNLLSAINANYLLNKIFGDAISETSINGTKNHWNNDYMVFMGLYYPFSSRGGRWASGETGGIFAFNRGNCITINYYGFRSVLVAN